MSAERELHLAHFLARHKSIDLTTIACSGSTRSVATDRRCLVRFEGPGGDTVELVSLTGLALEPGRFYRITITEE